MITKWKSLAPRVITRAQDRAAKEQQAAPNPEDLANKSASPFYLDLVRASGTPRMRDSRGAIFIDWLPPLLEV
jgi:hypothetical protein